MLWHLAEGNAAVLNTAVDPEHIQALYLWKAGSVPARTRFSEDMTDAALASRYGRTS